MKPGDKLPPERQLAEMFGVGRSSVRDAVRRLQAMGLVEPRQGHGTVICEVSDHSIISPLSSVLIRKWKLVAELLDVRKIIEPGIAARAAGNASPEQISAMEEILQRQEAKLSRGESAIEEDSEFHYCLALAANNSVVLRVLDVLMDLLQKSREQSLQAQGASRKVARRSPADRCRHQAEGCSRGRGRHATAPGGDRNHHCRNKCND